MTQEEFNALTIAQKVSLEKRWRRAKHKKFKEQFTISGIELTNYMTEWLSKQKKP